MYQRCTTQLHNPEWKRNPRRFVAVENSGTPSWSTKNGPLSSRTWEQVMSEVASVLSNKWFESVSFFTDGGTYCRTWYSNYRKTSKCPLLKKDNYFVKARNWNDEARLRTEGDRSGQTPYPEDHYPLPPPDSLVSPRPLNKSSSSKGRNTRYASGWGPGSNRLYTSAQANRLTNIAKHSRR